MESGGIQWVDVVPSTLVDAADRVAAEFPDAGIVAQLATGAIVGANAAAAALLGLTWEQLVGRTSMDPRWSAVSEQGLPLTGDQHPAMVTLGTGQPVAGFLMGVSTPVDVGDLGRTLARTRWIEIASHPATDAGGGVVGVVTSFVDASGTARGRAASDAQWASFQLMLQNTGDVLVRVDPGGIVQWASLSSSRVLGWAPEALVGRSLADLVHPDDRVLVRDLRESVHGQLPQEAARLAEFRFAVPGDGWRWVSDAASALRDRDLGFAGEVHSLRDIGPEVAARTALAESERRYRLIAENSSDVIVRFRDGAVIWVSPSVTRTLGGTPQTWVGRPLDTMIDADDLGRAQRLVESLHRNDSQVMRLRVIALSGQTQWVDAHVRVYLDETGEPDGYIASLRVVNDLVRAEQALQHQARTDVVTGLANRVEMMSVVSRLLDDDRRRGRATAMLFCDLDDFKGINDSAGHGVGDQVLQLVGERLVGAVRKGDAVGRIGGDEFMVVLYGVLGLDEAVRVAEKVRSAVAAPMPTDAGDLVVTVSIGVTLVRPDETGDDLVARADAAMYAAKRAGRDRVVAA